MEEGEECVLEGEGGKRERIVSRNAASVIGVCGVGEWLESGVVAMGTVEEELQ